MNGNTREVALWAGLSAFFGNLVGLKLLEALSGNDFIQIAGAVFISLIVAGAVYSKERLTAAKHRHVNGERSATTDKPSR